MALALLGGGCGKTDEDRAKSAVKEYLSALEERDWQTACDLLVTPGAGCAKPSPLSQADIRSALPKLLGARIEKVSVHGGGGVVRGAAGAWSLAKEADGWKITRPLLAPRGDEPAAPAEQTDTGSGDPTKFAGEAARAFDDGRAKAKRLRPARRKDLTDEEQRALGATSPFLQAQETLPIRQPPLPVQQYIVQERSHVITARPDLGDFLCRLRTPAARLAAVRAFYLEADAVFRSYGVRRWQLVVAPYSNSTSDIEPLARASSGSVVLTPFGRGNPSDC